MSDSPRNSIIIWHNPRCSKSRQTLALIEEKGIRPEVIEYLKTPPSAADIKSALSKLDVGVEHFVRRKEAEFKALDVDESSLSEQAWCELLADNPRLIERPLVIHGNKARLGRPPQAVLEILP